MTRYQWLFWDIGGVLTFFDFDLYLERMSRLFNTTPDKMLHFLQHKDKPPFWIQFESGLNEKEIRSGFCGYFGVDVPPLQFREVFNSGIIANDYERLEKVRRKIRAAGLKQRVISDINAIHAKHVQTVHPFLLRDVPSCFCFYSYRLGFRKGGGTEIFDLVFKMSGAVPENSILVDDRPDNIKGFEAVGGKGILFDGFHKLEDGLIRLGAILRGR